MGSIIFLVSKEKFITIIQVLRGSSIRNLSLGYITYYSFI